MQKGITEAITGKHWRTYMKSIYYPKANYLMKVGKKVVDLNGMAAYEYKIFIWWGGGVWKGGYGGWEKLVYWGSGHVCQNLQESSEVLGIFHPTHQE